MNFHYCDRSKQAVQLPQIACSADLGAYSLRAGFSFANPISNQVDLHVWFWLAVILNVVFPSQSTSNRPSDLQST